MLPESVSVTDGVGCGVVRIRHEDEFIERQFNSATFAEFLDEYDIDLSYPYENVKVIPKADPKQFLSMPLSLFLKFIDADVPPEVITREVVYVGQSFGKQGERTAWDRLKSHSTLQRIYAEARPDRETWLSLCAITDLTMPQMIIAGRDALIQDDEENVDRAMRFIAWFQGKDFRSREAVGLAEAGLIRYFQPSYNQRFRNTFPSPDHVDLKDCLNADLANLYIELLPDSMNSSYWSPNVKPASYHVADFDLFDPTVRAGMLGGLLDGP
jgi:hypothetical protein